MSVPTTLDSFFLIFAPVADTRIEEDASCADSTASTTGRASEVRYIRQVNLAGTTYGNQFSKMADAWSILTGVEVYTDRVRKGCNMRMSAEAAE